MTWGEVAAKVLPPEERGRISNADWVRAMTAMERLAQGMVTRGINPPDYMAIGGQDLLMPMLNDPGLRAIAEWVLDRTSKATKGEELPTVDVIPGRPEARKRRGPGKAKKQPKVETEGERDPAVALRTHDEEEEDEDAMNDANQFEEEPEVDEASPEEEIEEARTPRKQPQRVVERVIVQQAAPRRAPKRQQGQQSQGQGGRRRIEDLLPTPERVRIHVRTEDGRRERVNDYSLDDLGDMQVKDFIEQYIDPEYGNADGQTRYEVNKLDPMTGRERMPTHTIIVNSARQAAPQQPDMFGQLHRAFEFVNTLKQQTTPQEPLSPMLQAAQQKAVASGDMQSLMMLMMMERMMKPQGGNDDLLLKVLDRLDRMSGAKPSAAPAPDFGPPMNMAPMPPMPFMMPPPPPPPPPQTESKLIDMLLAKSINQPSTIDTLKELAALQQFMGGNQNNPMMAQLLSTVQTLAGEVAQIKGGGISKGGLEDAVATFEKVGTMVKALAPQVGGGGESAGIGSALQNIITPKLGQALGDALAGGLEKQKAAEAQAAGQAAAPASQPQQVAAPQPPPRDPNRPPNPVPQSVRDAAAAISVAQTHAVRVERFIDFIQAMFMSGDPYYAKVLQPALEGLNEAEKGVEKLTPARTLAYYLALEVAPSAANPDFADDAIEVLAKRFGVQQLPPTFTKTRGLWLLDARGQLVWKSGSPPVVLLDGSIAVPMNEPAPAPAPIQTQPPPPPPPSPVEAKQLVEHTGWETIEAPASVAVIDVPAAAAPATSNVIQLTVEAPAATAS